MRAKGEGKDRFRSHDDSASVETRSCLLDSFRRCRRRRRRFVVTVFVVVAIGINVVVKSLYADNSLFLKRLIILLNSNLPALYDGRINETL